MSASIVQSVFTSTMKSLGDAGRVVQFTGTLESTDRMGDVIEAKGWDLKNYVKNPVFLWDHDPGLPPIGKVLKVEHKSNALVFDVEFAPADINPFADMIFKSFKQGFLSAVSVGFIPKEIEHITDKKSGEVTGFRIKKQELLELSAVSIPAHQDALAASMFKKSLDTEVGKLKHDEKKHRPEACSLSDFLDSLHKDLPVVQVPDETLQKSMEELDEEDMKEIEELKVQVAELAEQVKSLITLRETVDLSKSVVDTLNKSIVALMSKSVPAVDLKSIVDQSGVPPTTVPDLAPVTKALEALMARVNGASNFTPKIGDK